MGAVRLVLRSPAARGRALLFPCCAALVAVLFLGAPASAQQPSEAPATSAPDDPRIVEAQALYERGVVQVVKAQWAEALASFEGSAKLRPHPTTTFNVGACERALGRYARARST